ncbi:MAG: hypothetical protein P1U32_07165 [Legionellaceae bacterium]|nr:hypothetical protein [Legionellaceae bacterium]
MDITTRVTGVGSASIMINLDNYITAYHQQEVDRDAFVALRMDVKYEMQEVHYTFNELADEALTGISDDQKEIIKNSPAYFFMRRQFAESLKNAIDSFLIPHEHDANNPNRVARLDLNIQPLSPEGEVHITLSDNGMGFKPILLEKIATKESREANDYYRAAATTKPPQKASPEDPFEKAKKLKIFIGGAGQGLAELVGLADKGDPKYGREKGNLGGEDLSDDRKTDGSAEKILYELPEKSELIFSNKDNDAGESGAVISITTSKDPIHAIKNKPLNEDVIPALPKKLQNRRQSTTSPDTVTRAPSPEEREPTSKLREKLADLRTNDESAPQPEANLPKPPSNPAGG